MTFDHKLTFATPNKRERWFFPVLVFPLIVGALAYVLSKELPRKVMETPLPTLATTAARTAATPAPVVVPVKKVDIDYVVKPNDTLGQIFAQLKIDVTDLPAILNAPAVREKFKPLKPGDKLMLALENGVLHGMHRRISETETLSIIRSSNGFTAKVVTKPIEIKTAQVRGTFNSSLFASGRAVGLTPELVQQLANDIFGWDIDFALDVRPGDRFNIVYEQKYRDGEYLGDGRIVAAEFISRSETHRAIYYSSSDKKIDGYFTPDGRRVNRQFMRTPIDFTRSNSNTAEHRSVINTMNTHHGIDYMAPMGTAIKAVGDGTVRFAGVNGEYGNVVIIEHGAKTSTLYAHMSTFARGLHTHQRINQGEVIGYVGNSGSATAPHLHYEYRVNGIHTDPRTAETPEAASIPAQYLEDFRSKSVTLLAHLERPGETVVTASLSN